MFINVSKEIFPFKTAEKSIDKRRKRHAIKIVLLSAKQ